MNFLDRWAVRRVMNQADVATSPEGTIDLKQINEFFESIRHKGGDNLSEATYLTCIKTLYETIGKLNLDLQMDTENGTCRVYDHEAVPVMRYRMNPHMTPTTAKQLLEFNRNHYGNAYAFIHRDGQGRLLSLVPLDPQRVTVLVDNVGVLGEHSKVMYRYRHPKSLEDVLIHEMDMVHLKFSLTTPDGLVGRSVQEVLATTLDGAKASQEFLNNLYQRGMTAKAVLQYVGDLSEKNVEKLKEKIEREGAGQGNAGRVLTLPPGTQLQTLDLKLTDSQFFELRKYSALEISAVFGVKPTQINDYDKASYASSEAQNLSFYVDTLLAIVKQWEEELAYKLLSEDDVRKGLHFKFNVSSMLRADVKTQSEIMATYVNNGIMSPNEARDKLDLLSNAYGDLLMANGNYIPLEQVGKQYQKG